MEHKYPIYNSENEVLEGPRLGNGRIISIALILWSLISLGLVTWVLILTLQDIGVLEPEVDTLITVVVSAAFIIPLFFLGSTVVGSIFGIIASLFDRHFSFFRVIISAIAWASTNLLLTTVGAVYIINSNISVIVVQLLGVGTAAVLAIGLGVLMRMWCGVNKWAAWGIPAIIVLMSIVSTVLGASSV